MSTITRRIIPATAVAGMMALMTVGCVAGEGSADAAPEGSEWSAGTLSVDWATYNPLSLVI
ncbi:MAG: aliphatic sulfonates ABC transporter substrate-binding protein, partial [Microbacterium gubbeenense]